MARRRARSFSRSLGLRSRLSRTASISFMSAPFSGFCGSFLASSFFCCSFGSSFFWSLGSFFFSSFFYSILGTTRRPPG